jgi:hypothetical protein
MIIVYSGLPIVRIWIANDIRNWKQKFLMFPWQHLWILKILFQHQLLWNFTVEGHICKYSYLKNIDVNYCYYRYKLVNVETIIKKLSVVDLIWSTFCAKTKLPRKITSLEKREKPTRKTTLLKKHTNTNTKYQKKRKMKPTGNVKLKTVYISTTFHFSNEFIKDYKIYNTFSVRRSL